MPADLQVLRAAYPLLAKASSVFDAVILAEASATDLAVMVTLPVKGGRYSGLSDEDNASAARLLARLGVKGLVFDSPPSSQEILGGQGRSPDHLSD